MTDDPFDRIMAGLGEALRHAQGEDVPGMVIHRVDIAAAHAKIVERYPAVLDALRDDGSASTGVAAQVGPAFREES
jgi:hypothetical protein